jgi:hypothetical protein
MDREELQRQLEQALEREPESERTLRLAAAVLEIEGECRLAEPFAPLRLVMTNEGVHWCCTHHPEHCAPAVGDLR